MSSKLEDLEPITRAMAAAFLEDANRIDPGVRLTQTERTLDEQLHLWAQGRELRNGVWIVVQPGRIVTKAPPGKSAHNFRMGFDICWNGADPYLHAYEVEHRVVDPRWLQVGKLGEAHGLSWGGPNGKGDRFTFDRPHFERRDWHEASKAA